MIALSLIAAGASVNAAGSGFGGLISGANPDQSVKIGRMNRLLVVTELDFGIYLHVWLKPIQLLVFDKRKLETKEDLIL